MGRTRTNRAPSFRWVWTGRFEDARKVGPDILDGFRAALAANREAAADLDGVQRAIDSGDIDAVLAAAAKSQLSQETCEAALRLHPFREGTSRDLDRRLRRRPHRRPRRGR